MDQNAKEDKRLREMDKRREEFTEAKKSFGPWCKFLFPGTRNMAPSLTETGGIINIRNSDIAIGFLEP